MRSLPPYPKMVGDEDGVVGVVEAVTSSYPALLWRRRHGRQILGYANPNISLENSLFHTEQANGLCCKSQKRCLAELPALPPP